MEETVAYADPMIWILNGRYFRAVVIHKVVDFEFEILLHFKVVFDLDGFCKVGVEVIPD